MECSEPLIRGYQELGFLQTLDLSEIDNMDCYVGLEGGNFAVSNCRRSSLRFPSPNYCLQWGVATSEHFGSANEYCIGATNVTSEELNFNRKSLSDEVEDETSIPGESSIDSSWCERFPFVDCSHMNSEASLDWIRHLSNLPDYQLDGIGWIDQTDDFFLRSLLEEALPSTESPYVSVSTYPVSACSTMASENLLRDMIANSQSISVNASTTSSSQNHNSSTHCFPSLADWDREENTPNVITSNSGTTEDCSITKEPVVPGLMPAELNSPYRAERYLIAGRSFEESVLQELEVAMEQLTKSTRLCFRDSFYRLAKSSEQPHVISRTRSGEIMMEKHSLSSVHHKTSRFPGVDAPDYQTSTIDRTIEKLMFDKLDCDTPSLSFVASINSSKETAIRDGSIIMG
ncbi:hypothetical protein NE237_004070 [Protea cynaroides]|uniref:Uncharacterized protein n=1 Tax=Protea cynaroides TaxID=273540 RepID=A0A9Q0KIP7_9MAGN|nr:hypothetical protein NE237_004070 [Protea cynaroides]